MKKLMLFAVLIALAIPALPQTRKYIKSMARTIELMNSATLKTEYLQIVDQFKEIENTYPDQWLPHYYQAQAMAMASLNEKDIPTIDGNLDRAQEAIEKADSIQPDESEIYVIKALVNLGRITVDPAGRSALYFEAVSTDLSKAKELDPKNPRAHFLHALFTLYLPEFLGGGPAGAKPLFLDAAEKFKTFENPDPLWPDWGEDLNQDELEKLKDL
jgi:hypothetical protein